MGGNFVGGTTATSLLPQSPADRWAAIQGIIAANLDRGFNLDCAVLMADMENGFSIGDFTETFQATNSLYNRHVGNGIIGEPNSDGFWTGNSYNAGPADPDLRVYASLEQSVQDFMDLMNDPLYADAYNAAQRNDVLAFIAAVAHAGYSNQVNYQAALTSRGRELGFLA